MSQSADVDEETLRVEPHMIACRKVELGFSPAEEVWLRVPSFWPPEAGKKWHGPYPDVAAAERDFSDRTALPKVTREQIAAAKERGEHGTVDNVPVLTIRHRWTGHTTLTRYTLAEADATAGAPK